MRAFGVGIAALALAAPAFGSSGNMLAGESVFKASCGSCHALAAAHTTGASQNHGPPLTNRRETAQRILVKLEGIGGDGLMPTYVGVLSTKQIDDVIAFVVAASKPGVKNI